MLVRPLRIPLHPPTLLHSTGRCLASIWLPGTRSLPPQVSHISSGPHAAATRHCGLLDQACAYLQGGLTPVCRPPATGSSSSLSATACAATQHMSTRSAADDLLAAGLPVRQRRRASRNPEQAAPSELVQQPDPGLVQLAGTGQEIFNQALAWTPPALPMDKAAELAELVEKARQRPGRVPPHTLLQGISRALDLSARFPQQFPQHDLAQLLQPFIAAARHRVSAAQLLPRIKRVRRVLPDTQLRAALLQTDPADVSRTVAQAVSAFVSVLGMQPPVQLLSAPPIFVRMLRLEPDKLQQHLHMLKAATTFKHVAQRLAQRYTKSVLGPHADVLLGAAKEVGGALGLQKDEAAEFVLRHPWLASTDKQLQRFLALTRELPQHVKVSKKQLNALLVQQPRLLRYSSVAALEDKVQAVRQWFPGASDADVLRVCSLPAVMRYSTSTLGESLQIAARIMAYKDKAPLLPVLLKAAAPDEPLAANPEPSYRSKNTVFVLQPARQLALRAVYVQRLLGYSKEQLARLARAYPHLLFNSNTDTVKLKAMLLQLQLRGDGSRVVDDQLAPEISQMLRRTPWLNSLNHGTRVDHIQQLQGLLQLDASQVAALALRQPQLLVYAPRKLAELYQQLSELLGGQDKAKQLTLRFPKVLPLLSRLQAADGNLPAVAFIQQLLTQQSPQQGQQSGSLSPQHPTLDPAAALSAVTAAVQAAAAAAEQQGLAHSSYAGIKQRSRRWEMRFQGRSFYFGSQVHAACAYDLAVLASGSRALARAKFKHQPHMYSSAQVQAMAQYLQAIQKQQQQKQQGGSSQLQPAGSAGSHEAAAIGTQATPHAAAAGETAVPAATGTWDVVRQLLQCSGGVTLLQLSAESAEARLNTLAALTGLSAQQVLQQCLSGATHWQMVMKLSPSRMEAAAAHLQQLLQLSQPELQALLQRAPCLLTYKDMFLTQKVEALCAAFQHCYAAATSEAASFSSRELEPHQPLTAAVATGSSWTSSNTALSSSSSSREYGAPLPDSSVLVDPAALVCLQRAALRSPEVLLLSADKVVRRLHVLQSVSQEEAGIQRQLQSALSTGGVGRWLCSGDAHFEALKDLAAARSPLLQELQLSRFFRGKSTSSSAVLDQ